MFFEYKFTAPGCTWPRLQERLTSLTSFTAVSLLPGMDLNSDAAGPKSDQISRLPSSLTRLSLNFPRAESCWAISNYAGAAFPTEIPTLMSLYVPMSEILPNLLTLELAGAESVLDDWVPTLPRTLTSLTLKNNNRLTDVCVPNLPPGMTILNLPHNDRLTGLGLKRLPLSKLTLSGKALAPNLLISGLSMCLEDLELPHNTHMNNDDIAKLPRSIARLSLPANSTIKGDAFSLLSPGLTSLTTAADINDADILRLPKHMITLALHRCSKLSNEAIGYLPRTLTLFSAWNAANITDEAIPLLPKSLKYLYLDAPNLTDECAPFLPSTLLELKIQTVPLTDNFFAAIRLPNLVRLELSGARAVSDHSISLLPPNLRYLHLPSAEELTQACMHDIPRTLEIFVAWSSQGFTWIPPTLKYFYSADLTLLPGVFSAPVKS